jgi:hypothetical protein
MYQFHKSYLAVLQIANGDRLGSVPQLTALSLICEAKASEHRDRFAEKIFRLFMLAH